MNKSFTRLGVFLFSLLGILMLSCGSTSMDNHEENPNSPENRNSIQPNKGNTTKKEKTREQAFAEVANALHAPYSSGDKFFRIFTGTNEINETKEGSAVSVKDGDNSIGGSGKLIVKAGKNNEKQDNDNKDNAIVYTYEKFQPKGSKISIDGKMISMYRSKSLDGQNKDAIGFHKNGNATKKNNNGIVYSSGNNKDKEVKVGVNGVKDIKDPNTDGANYSITLADTLNISGEYQAKLEFIYPSGAIHSDVGADDYETKLLGGNEGMFTRAGSYIEFTYNGETKKLTKDEIKKLITVA